jgi:gamma-glutamyltranspeptidase
VNSIRLPALLAAALSLAAGLSLGPFAVRGLSAGVDAVPAPQATGPAGVREAAWAPDGRRIAAAWFDAIWTMNPEGRSPRRLVSRPAGWVSERDPAWSPDGRSIAFSADTDGQFDIWVAPASGGDARRITSQAGDERWPSWTPDGRIVFAHRPPDGRWQVFATAAEGAAAPVKITPDDAAEWFPRVSPDGGQLAFVSDRDRGAGDEGDVWVRPLPAPGGGPAGEAIRVTAQAGLESHPAWAPDGGRIAYRASRQGQTGVWVSVVPADGSEAGRGGRGGRGRGGVGRGGGRAADPAAGSVVLASRHAGAPAWSPDGETLLIATFPEEGGGYNGNPTRNDDDPPIALAEAEAYQFWRVEAPRAVDAGAAEFALPDAPEGRFLAAFDRVWQTLKTLYYEEGEGAAAWDAARAELRPRMDRVRDAAAAEAVIDELVGRQPLINRGLESPRAVVSSGHPLASAAGARVLAAGGNVIDAGIAVSFALGVVEPDASGLGGDGQAILFLKGMSEPVIVEYKDMTPMRAVRDNPRLFDENGSRTANDGPTVVAIPGVPAGLHHLFEHYGSGQVPWADLIAPAIELAEDGYILDEALPTTIEEGRDSFERYPASAEIFLPDGRVPRAGDRFVNRDYARTLRTLADEGGEAFYRGSIAERIAADMAANGGVLTLEDLAQYRAIERKPLAGHYRGHRVYSVAPPVSTGLSLIETLQILDHYPARAGARYTSDADYLHHVIEAWRVRDGGARIADPERYPVDLGHHLEPEHARERFELIDPARSYTPAGRGRGGAPARPSTGAEDEARRVQTGTTSFVVADAEGNMIAFTQTLSTWGGSYYVSDGLGFLYNDHFRGGVGGTNFGARLPLTRTSTTSVPTLVFAPETGGGSTSGVPGFVPRLAVGAAGNAWIPASVYNVILNVIDGGMGAQEAIEAPRLLIGGGAGGSRVQIEDRLPSPLLDDLTSRGHTFVTVGRKGEVKYGYAALAVIHADRGTVEGGAEPRRSHGTAAPGG